MTIKTNDRFYLKPVQASGRLTPSLSVQLAGMTLNDVMRNQSAASVERPLGTLSQ